GPSPKGGSQQAGRTEGNRMVVLEGTSYAPGELVDVEITDADGWTHRGVPEAPGGEG
ncbi:TRAM domain-containing protein, partial [Candidatus Fermentibacterales bacterium]|nr:TRAM domain-containing protein [Candidatus Fermentibacterales bacterium]